MKEVELQSKLDVEKWLESESNGKDMCGTYEYCAYCQNEEETPCANAYMRLKAKNVAKAEPTKKAPAKKTTKKTTTKKAEAKPVVEKKVEAKPVVEKKAEPAKKAPAKKATKKTK